MASRLSFLGITALISLPAFADDSADVRRWVRELDAPQRAVRVAAEREILELGERALEFLPPEDAKLSPEVSKRLDNLRSQIGRRTAIAEVEQIRSDIDLSRAQTLGEALRAITGDSGIAFLHDGNDRLPIKPYPTSLPFWNAVDFVLDQAKLDIDFYRGEPGMLALRPRSPESHDRVDAAAYAGIYRVEPTRVIGSRVLTNDALSEMKVELDLAWMPNANPIGITVPMNSVTALLDDGAIIKARNSASTIDVAPSRDIPMASIELPLDLPAGRPSKITTLSGTVKSILPGERTFEFPLKLGQQTQTRQFVTVRVEDIRKNGTLHEVRMDVQFSQAGKAMESHRGFLIGNTVFVEMPDGARREHLGFELYRHNESGIGVGYLFDIGDSIGNAVLMYETPTAVAETQIDFVIRDIALP